MRHARTKASLNCNRSPGHRSPSAASSPYLSSAGSITTTDVLLDATKRADRVCSHHGFSASRLDLDWRFTQLQKVLSVSPNLEGDFLVVEELTLHASERPLDVLDCVERLLRCENPRWLVIGSRARFETIFSKALRHDDV